MSYFKHLPRTFYRGDNKAQVLSAIDIVTRAKIMEYVEKTQALYLDYVIRDGERPEHLADRMYGDPELHWIILMFNEIHDPYFEWPMSSPELEEKVKNNYSGKAYFIDYKEALGDVLNPYPPKNYWIEEGVELSVEGINTPAMVTKWNPNLYKIVVDENSPSNVEGLRFTQIRSDGVTVRGIIKRAVLDNRYAVHHFENETTQAEVDHHLIDPLSLDQNNTGADNVSYIDRYVLNSQDVIVLADKTILPVTNYDYEIRLNDSKRVIRMPSSTAAAIIRKEIGKVFSGG